MKERLRKMFLEMLNQQLKTDTGISTRINLYMVEVKLLEDLLEVFTGFDSDNSNLSYDNFHDTVCNFLEEMHQTFDC